MSMEEPEE